MQRARPELQFIAPVLPGLRSEVEQLLQASGMAGRVNLLDGRSHAALAACDATLIASGTATLEAALFKRPMVIAYNMNGISWALMRRKQLQPWVGLPNILCERVRRARAAAGSGDAAGAGRCDARLAGARRTRFTPCNNVFARCMPNCSAIRRHCAPMRSRKFLKAEQATLAWDAPGPHGRRRRGRARPAGRAGRRRGRDPRRPAADPRPGRFEDPDRAAARAPERPDPGQGAVLLGGAGQRRGDRHPQHPAGHDARDAARGGGAAAQAGQGAGRRQPAAHGWTCWPRPSSAAMHA